MSWWQDLLKLHVANLHDIAYKVQHVAPFHSPQINNWFLKWNGNKNLFDYQFALM